MADLSSPKIMSRTELETFAEKRRQQGFVLVTTNGTFDLLHVGHIKNLEEAKSLGDVLIVGINDDASVRAYKGLDRPFLPDVERAYMLAALNCVDAVCIFNEVDIHKPLIELVLPDFHVKGKQYEGACMYLCVNSTISLPVLQDWTQELIPWPHILRQGMCQLIML